MTTRHGNGAATVHLGRHLHGGGARVGPLEHLVVRHGDGQHGGIRRPEREQRDAEIYRDDRRCFLGQGWFMEDLWGLPSGYD